MDNKFIFKTVFFLLIATVSEGIFFDYPKKTLMDFLHSLKEKKETTKKSHEDIHHYHLHYYPVPVSLVIDDPVKIAIGNHELEHLHREELKSSGWGTNHEYKYVPEPEIVLPISQHRETIGDPRILNHQNHDLEGLTIEDQLDIAAIKHEIEKHSHRRKVQHVAEPRHQTHISLHLPFHQEIIFQSPPTSPPEKIEEKKVHPFIAFFQKLHHIKNSLFSTNEDKKPPSRQCEDKMEKPVTVTTIASKLKATNAYAIYFHPKNLRKF